MVTIETPWGRAERVDILAPDVAFYATPSHGGFRVSGASLEKIPAAWRAYGKNWAHGCEGWFEEDCAWACVALTFPDLFPAPVVDSARRIAALRLPKVEG